MRVLLFTGKGGVGKTTLAAATAVHLAGQGRKVLLLSVDSAHSVGDALGASLSAEPREVGLETAREASSGARLHAAEIHSRTLVDAVWSDLREHLRTVLVGAGVEDLDAEELTLLPGVEDLLALGEVHRLAESGLWDTVLVDCGPTAETLRLLALPEALASYLERLFPTHRRLVRGLLASIAGSDNEQRWDAVADALGRLAERLSTLREMLTSVETSVRLVLTPESVVAAETRRTLTAMALQGIRVDELVANRLVPSPGSERGTAAQWLRARQTEQSRVIDSLREATDLPVRTVEYRADEPVGPEALLGVGSELYGDQDPLRGSEQPAAMEVTGGGRDLDSEYSLRIRLPLEQSADLDLVRVGDELAITIDGRRRLITLPSVLRRCVVTGAVAGEDGMTVAFRPDPELWMR